MFTKQMTRALAALGAFAAGVVALVSSFINSGPQPIALAQTHVTVVADFAAKTPPSPAKDVRRSQAPSRAEPELGIGTGASNTQQTCSNAEGAWNITSGRDTKIRGFPCVHGVHSGSFTEVIR